MPIPNPYIALYTEGPLVTPGSFAKLKTWVNSLPPGDQKTMLEKDLKSTTSAADVAVAGFNIVIVGLWHVNEDGTINYNDFPYDTNTADAFNEAIHALRNTPGSTVQTVLVSFGGGYGVSDLDYPRMKTHWAKFKPLLLDMMRDVKADGVDWDYEPVSVPFDAEFIARITNEIWAKKSLVTAAPYDEMENWKSVIEATAHPSGLHNNFAWWNLQANGVPYYSEWIKMLQTAKVGVPPAYADRFLIPGGYPQGCDYQYSIDTIKHVKKGYPTLGGAFMWNYEDISKCAPAVAKAIRGVF